MDPDKLQAMLVRMEWFVARGIVVEISPREPAPLVFVQVRDPEDGQYVTEITELALAIHQEMAS